MTSVARPPGMNDDLVQALALAAQRSLLEEVGREIGTPVVFLKAAWADPVLYGGRGRRRGADLDALVAPDRHGAFVAALEARGFRRCAPQGGARGQYFEAKEVSLLPPPGSAYFVVDLHRALADPCWYDFAVGPLLARARGYDSLDGTLISLDPEDQVLYACVHHAVHAFDLDDRHASDVVLLMAQHPVDWEVVCQRAQAAGLCAVLLLLVDRLRVLGAKVPPLPVERAALVKLRAAVLRHLLRTRERVHRTAVRSRALDYLVVRPLMSDRLTALPSFAFRYGVPWLIEAVLRTLRDRRGDELGAA